MMELRYTMYLMNNKSYSIDQADLEKLKENAGEMLVQLKQVMVHPPSISAIEPYNEPYVSIPVLDGDRYIQGEPVPPKPLKDLFANIKQLTNGKN